MKQQNNYQYSFILPFILSHIPEISENSRSIIQINYGILLISILALYCFLNIIFYLITYILIDKGGYENKYPKLKRIINYYKNINLIFIIIDIIICFICLLILTIFPLLIILKYS